MLRAAVLGARLGFDMDVLVVEAIAELRHLITKASPARLLEEYFKILRSGYAEASFRALGRVRLLELMTPELKSPPAALWDSLARLDRFRQRPGAPPRIRTTILIGALLQPIGALNRRMPDRGSGDDDFRSGSVSGRCRSRARTWTGCGSSCRRCPGSPIRCCRRASRADCRTVPASPTP